MSDQLKSAVVSYARFVAVAILTAYVALGKTPFETTGDDLKVIASAGFAAAVGVLLNALNPKDARYGVGS